MQVLVSNHKNMHIQSDWENNWFLPKVYTCEGMEKFPELHLDAVPLIAQWLALVVEDPDAPWGTWDHLLVANIPITGNRMDISLASFSEAVIGSNSWGELGRWAPCPPQWIHRYFFTVYALSEKMELSTGFSKQGFLTALQWNVLAEAGILECIRRENRNWYIGNWYIGVLGKKIPPNN